MSVVGVGTDLVNIKRIQKIYTRFGNKISSRILTKAEHNVFEKNNNNINFLAKRFAAKEAIMKALGTGWTHGIIFQDIEIYHEIKPNIKHSYISVSKEAKVILKTPNISKKLVDNILKSKE